MSPLQDFTHRAFTAAARVHSDNRRQYPVTMQNAAHLAR
jgi:hypothetical protein